ncbi:MAG TPA: hypothetical protein VFE38_02270 [Edaphobacter sp.]|nr:hypothetical protein [Edaphobacter sp.]
MASCQAIAFLLEQTVDALALFDLERLRNLEREAASLADAPLHPGNAELQTLIAKKQVLERVLQQSTSNLDALNRLYERRTREQWERSPH